VDDLTERWLPVVGWEDLYEVSNRGQVRSLDRWKRGCGGSRYVQRGQPISQRPDNRGYLCVWLSRDGQRVLRRVHRLVLDAFAQPRPDGQQARHGPAGKLVNHWPENLCWGTPTENQMDRLRDGTMGLKLAAVTVADIRRRYAAGGILQRELASEYGVSRTTIAMITTRRRWGVLARTPAGDTVTAVV